MQNVAHADCFLHIFVRVYGRDSATCRAELFVTESVFFKAVLRNIVRTTNDCFVADFEICGSYGNSAVSESCDFLAEMLYIHDHTVAHNVDFVFSQNTRRQKIENELSFFVYDGVSRVVSALIADDHVLRFGKQVNHTAFAFVAPVDTND